MEAAWRFRIMLIMAFAVIIFGDFLGYGGAAKSDSNKDNTRKSSATIKNERHSFDLDDEGKWLTIIICVCVFVSNYRLFNTR